MKHPVNVLDRLGPLCLIDSGDDGVDISRNTLGVNFFLLFVSVSVGYSNGPLIVRVMRDDFFGCIAKTSRFQQ